MISAVKLSDLCGQSVRRRAAYLTSYDKTLQKLRKNTEIR